MVALIISYPCLNPATIHGLLSTTRIFTEPQNQSKFSRSKWSIDQKQNTKVNKIL